MQQKSSSRMVLTERGKRVLMTITVLPALVLGLTVFMNVGNAGVSATASSEAATETQFVTVTVGHGDTLWAIAQDIAPEQDPREVIAEIKKLNALSVSTVTPGQQLAVPLQYSSN